jgi:acetylornithine deacetylase/succinyl-diaminopimelate desuccinylase-like protein
MQTVAGRIALGGAALATAAAAGIVLYKHFPFTADTDIDLERLHFDDPRELTELDMRITTLAQQYAPFAVQMLSELIRLPESHLPSDPHCGESNHESARLDYLKDKIAEYRAVLDPSDIIVDDFGTLIWRVCDPDDTMPMNDRRVIYLDSHLDTYPACRDDWFQKLGGGIEPFQGLIDPTTVNDTTLKTDLTFIPPRSDWDNLLFGRGSVSSLQGIVTQVFATKILIETLDLGSLRGVHVVAVAGLSGEVNPGSSALYLLRSRHLEPLQIPDCVILTAATGDVKTGPCGIYIGEVGRCQVELEVSGAPNPVEAGALIVAEAAEEARAGFGTDKFLGGGSREAVRAGVDVVSDWAAPTRFLARFDRRLTRGETGQTAVREIEGLKSVARARESGLTVTIGVPAYREKSYRGAALGNPQEYLSWSTHPRSAAVEAAVETYKRTVSPRLPEKKTPAVDELRKTPRLGRWEGGTDGAGYLVRNGEFRFSITGRDWIEADGWCHPPMFGIGAGFEQHAHKAGEYVHKEHLWCPIAVVAGFPSVFRAKARPAG